MGLDGARWGAARIGAFFPERALPFWWSQLIALVCVAVATLVRLLLDPYLAGVPFITFFPAIIVAAVWGRTWAGVTTLILGAAIASQLWLFDGQIYAIWRTSSAALTVFLLFGCLLIAIIHFLHLVIAALRDAERRAELISGEMKHRVGNTIQLIQVISRMTAKNADDIGDFQQRFSDRLQALAKAQQMAAIHPETPADLGALIQELVVPIAGTRATFDGPFIELPTEFGGMLGLVIFELATNSAKYGSLSIPEGRVDVSWRKTEDDVEMTWRERNGPPVHPPDRKGFGTSLLKSAFPAERGTISVDYPAEGVVCVIVIRNTH
jgi:two-component sensor histidine kinase